MSVKPILFNTEMVKAILEGKKTCTRRVIKPQPTYNTRSGFSWKGYAYGTDLTQTKDGAAYNFLINAPYQLGDVLYVRETWCALPVNEAGHMRGHSVYYYKADRDLRPEGWRGNWHPSIHMPKEAARIWLRVTGVRVERLQDITEVQAQAEGIRGYSKDGNLYKYAVTDDWWIDFHNKHRKSFFGGTWWQDMPRTAKDAFSYLWNSTIKNSDINLYGWDANPFVWAIEFEWCEKPESEG